RDLLADFDGARGDHEAALALTQDGKDRVGEWQALLDLGFLWQGRDLARAGDYYQRARELAEGLGDPATLGQTLNRIGNWQMNLGQPREALPCHRQALALFRERDDQHGVAVTLDLLGIVSYQLGEVVQGAAYLEDAVSIFRALDDRQGLVNALINLAVRAHLDTEILGDIDFGQLAKLCEQALGIARGFHWYQGEVLALLQGAFTLGQAGEYGRALEWLDQARPLVDEGGNREAQARFHLIVGETLIGLLALTEARQHLETALAQLQELGSELLLMPAQGRLAWVALLENDPERGRAILAPLLPTEYPEGHELALRRSCWSVRAELELREGHPCRALEILDRMLASTPNRAECEACAVPRLSRLRGLALAGVERIDEAVSELQGALIVAEAQGLRPLVWQLHADLGTLYRASGRREEAQREFSSARTGIQELADRAPEGPLRDHFIRQALQSLPAAPAPTPGKTAKAKFGGLTAREREIAALIAQGKSNREIAGALVISETTAERHVANILSKLGFNSRTQIAIWAVQQGIGK
ncbi:MAG TPA: LuxR C-terminal-related transcriptional regulator, partial [Anaerolineae bacterium]